MVWTVWVDSKYKWHCSSSPNEESALETARVMMMKYQAHLSNPRVTFVKAGLFSHFALQGELIVDTRPNLIRKAVEYPSQVWVVNTNSRGRAIMAAKGDYQARIIERDRGNGNVINLRPDKPQ
jgi:hypothetical protein